jgi:hypothetical protein
METADMGLGRPDTPVGIFSTATEAARPLLPG